MGAGLGVRAFIVKEPTSDDGHTRGTRSRLTLDLQSPLWFPFWFPSTVLRILYDNNKQTTKAITMEAVHGGSVTTQHFSG